MGCRYVWKGKTYTEDEFKAFVSRMPLSEVAKFTGTETVPDAPFKTTWPMLAMKRMIRYAADNGYDRIAWTTGEQQADRYDLSKRVSEVRASRTPSTGLYDLTVTSQRSDHTFNDIPEAKLADYVGKDLADKIVERANKHHEAHLAYRKEIERIGSTNETMDPLYAARDKAKQALTFTGLDLKVGGEGMRGFYDKMLPNEINKYVKKWGAKVSRGSQEPGLREPPSDRGRVEEYAGLALNPVDRGMIAAAQNDKVLDAVVGRLPVDVVDLLSAHGVSAEDAVRQPSMLAAKLPVDDVVAVRHGIRDALSGTAADLRAGLDAGYEARLDRELLPALDASDLDTNVAAGILFPQALGVGDSDSTAAGGVGARGTGARAEARVSSMALNRGERPLAGLADFVKWHRALKTSVPYDAWHLNITPAMRESVQQGQAMFQPRPAYTFGREQQQGSELPGTAAMRRPENAVQPLAKPQHPRFLGLGIRQKLEKRGAVSLVGQTVSGPAQLAELAQVYRDQTQEVFRYFFMKGDRVVHQSGVSARKAGSTSMWTGDKDLDAGLAWVREQMATADNGKPADGYYILHNHPSGDPTASGADRNATELLASKIEGFLGHVIINSNKYAVLDAAGQGGMPIDAYFGADKLLEADIPHPYLRSQITQPSTVAQIGFAAKIGLKVVLIGTSGNGGVRAIMEVPAGRFINAFAQKLILAKFAKASGSDRIFAYGERRDLDSADVRALMNKGYLYEAVTEEGWSYMSAHGAGPGDMSMGRKTHERTVQVEQPPYDYKPGPSAAPEKRMSPEQAAAKKSAEPVTHLGERVRKAFDELKAAYTSLPEFTEMKAIIGRYTGALQVIDYKLAKEAKAINAEFPKARQVAITNYIQAGGDMALLDERARASRGEHEPGYRDALALTPREKEFAEQIIKRDEERWQLANNAGILEDHVENYVRGEWKKPNKAGARLSAMANSGAFSTKPREAMRKVFQNYFEGEQAGYEPMDKSIGYQFTAAERSIRRSIEARKALRDMLASKELDGEPSVVVGGGKPATGEDAPYLVTASPKDVDLRKYVFIPHPAFRKWKWIEKASDGKPILLEGNMWVHKQAASRLNALLMRSRIREYEFPQHYPVIGGIRPGDLALRASSFIKGTILIGPFHQFNVGEHALWHMVNPFNPAEIDFDKRPVLHDLVDHGLMLYNHNAMTEFAEGIASGGLLHKVPGLGALLNRYSAYLFQDYIPRLKAAMAEKALERALQHYAPELKSGKFTRDQLLENVANQANAAFGELNYKYIGRSPTVQDAARLFFLAPDFLEARFKFGAQAIRPGGWEQAMALIRSAIVMYLLARVVNMLFSEDHKAHWDKPFSMVIGGREYSPRSVVGDAAHLFTDPRGFWYHRLNPFTVTPALEIASGRDISGQKESLIDAFKNIFQSWTPIPAQGLYRKMGDSTIGSIVNAMLQSIGMANYAYRTPAERLASDLAFGDLPIAGTSPQEKARRQKFLDIRDMYESGKLNTVDEILAEADKRDVRLSRDQVRQITESRDQTQGSRLEHHIRKLSAEQVVQVWDKMNDEEKAANRDAVQAKIARSKVISADEKARLAAEVQ